MNLFSYIKQSSQILGMNSRNLDFVRPLNRERSLQIADNKLLAKEILEKKDLPVPATVGVISFRKELKNFNFASLPDSFVLKPNRGFGGEGIMVALHRKKNGNWVNSSGDEISLRDIKMHIQDILDGRFSMADIPDIAFFEERLKRDPMFKLISYKGIPDIRVIVFNKVPIMAMMRLPTRESRGKANLHQGGIGVGIDIATGITTLAIQHDQIIKKNNPLKEARLSVPSNDEHFDKAKAKKKDKNKLPKIINYSGIKIPHWQEILELSIKAQIVCKLGYLGVDIVLIKNKGPVILELNGHPGLSVQIANMSGLKDRLLRIKGLKVETPEKGLRIAHEIFGQDMTLPQKKESKKVLSTYELIWLYHKEGKQKGRERVQAKIDSGADSTSIDYELAQKLGYGELVEFVKSHPKINQILEVKQARKIRSKLKQELLKYNGLVKIMLIHSASASTLRLMVPVVFKLKGQKIKTKVSLIDRSHLKHDMIIGKKDLKGFLIDPSK